MDCAEGSRLRGTGGGEYGADGPGAGGELRAENRDRRQEHRPGAQSVHGQGLKIESYRDGAKVERYRRDEVAPGLSRFAWRSVVEGLNATPPAKTTHFINSPAVSGSTRSSPTEAVRIQLSNLSGTEDGPSSAGVSTRGSSTFGFPRWSAQSDMRSSASALAPSRDRGASEWRLGARNRDRPTRDSVAGASWAIACAIALRWRLSGRTPRVGMSRPPRVSLTGSAEAQGLDQPWPTSQALAGSAHRGTRGA